ncbi:DNA topoisomerase IB [Rhizobium sp. L1K21]|uniref:DNA topoisomerase IB n=1 Tax=Rhizobium sp. L1K21 TaxID=2954933 RepID=UPI002093C82B|nr:DNA topoisomerase IB [Rhizobium sp. L1K21]MCO6187825.1 DNA topoisomerase IB [Rhizobium sp. L1K21]
MGPTRRAGDENNNADIEKEIRRSGLVYVSDHEPGILRERRGRGFSYRYPDGSLVRDEEVKARIKALGIPPAHERVWICMNPQGHLQATGFDARGRKQYRYHPEWQKLRSEQKFDRLIAFAEMLPRIRRVARRDAEDISEIRNAVLGTLVLLLDAAHLRAGSWEYLDDNGTYGATTLMKRHVSFGNSLKIRFRGKGNRILQRSLHAPKLQKTLERIADLPGRELFSWRDNDGNLHKVDSGLLNQYLDDICEGTGSVSAKVFRTWGGTLAAFQQAATAIRRGESPSIKSLCEAAAEELCNTASICRSSYVHPSVIATAVDDKAAKQLEDILNHPPKPVTGMSRMEQRLLVYLRGDDAV